MMHPEVSFWPEAILLPGGPSVLGLRDAEMQVLA